MILILLIIKKNFSSKKGRKTQHVWLSGELVIESNSKYKPWIVKEYLNFILAI